MQAKPAIGESDDKYEQEADAVAAQVVEQINAPLAQQPSLQREELRQEEDELQMKPVTQTLQRQEIPLEEEEELQMKPIGQRREVVEGAVSPDLESTINRARGGGQAVDAGLQRSMGQAMGVDFRRVLVHTDAQADQLNQSIQAKAFTTGQDVFFRRGEYNPGSRGGQGLIAHELTHVVQQNGGAVQHQGSKGIGTQRRVLQRKVAAWDSAEVASGTEVYHCTNYSSAKNIIDNHIQSVPNSWGGGALGSGFYTHKTKMGAQNYVREDQQKILLKFRVTKKAVGQSVRPSDYANKTDVQENEDPVSENDFLSNAEDSDEVKWHGGNALELVGFALGPEFNKFYANEQEMEDELFVSLEALAG